MEFITWVNLAHVTHVQQYRDMASKEVSGIDVYFAGGSKVYIPDWDTKAWAEYVQKTFRSIQLQQGIR